MSQVTLFIQVQGDVRIAEVVVSEVVSADALRGALAEVGVIVLPDHFIFIDDAEEHLPHGDDHEMPKLRHGARVHITRCHKIKTTVHFMEKTIERSFSPGTRVRAVKAWAAQELHVDHKDAAEHVLQLCRSKERPPSDTPLHTLTHGSECAVCFDFVPEKRVEG